MKSEIGHFLVAATVLVSFVSGLILFVRDSVRAVRGNWG